MTRDARGDAHEGRLVWIDAARGLSVAAVVLFHVCAWWYLELDAALWPPAERMWTAVNGILGSVRMPLLLALSGLLASRRLRLGFRDERLRLRVLTNAYLYLVWLLVYAAFYALVSEPSLPHRIDGLGAVLRQVLVPETPLWFIFALVVYSLALGAVSRLPAWCVLPVVAAVSLLANAFLDGPGMWPRILQLAVFYAVGVYGAAALRRLVEHVTPLTVLAAAAVAAGITVLGRLTGPGLGDAAVSMARGMAFMVLAVSAVGLLARVRWLGRAGQALGRRTLPVYVMHVPLLGLLALVTIAVPPSPTLLAHPVLAVGLPLLVTAVTVALAIALHALAHRARLGALFELPARWRTRGAPAVRTPATTSSTTSPEPTDHPDNHP